MVVFAVETEPAKATPGMTEHRPAATANADTADGIFVIISMAPGEDMTRGGRQLQGMRRVMPERLAASGGMTALANGILREAGRRRDFHAFVA